MKANNKQSANKKARWRELTYVVNVGNAGCLAHYTTSRRQQLLNCYFLHSSTTDCR